MVAVRHGVGKECGVVVEVQSGSKGRRRRGKRSIEVANHDIFLFPSCIYSKSIVMFKRLSFIMSSFMRTL